MTLLVAITASVHAPLTLPKTGGGNIVFRDGSLHVSPQMLPNDFLVEFDNASDTGEDSRHLIYCMKFDSMEFDASNVAAGGISMSQFLGIQIKGCIFTDFV